MSKQGNGGTPRRRTDGSKGSPGRNSSGRTSSARTSSAKTPARSSSGRSSSAGGSSSKRRSGGPAQRSNQRPTGRQTLGGRQRAPARPRIRVPDGTPSIAASMARGLLSSMSSIPLVVLTLGSVFLLWAAFVSVGLGSQPSVMSQYLALPPIHSALDLDFLFTAARVAGGGGAALVAFLLLIVFRAFFAVVAISLAADAHAGVRPHAAIRRAASLLKGKIVRLFLIESGFLFVALASLAVLAGFLGLLGVVLPLVAALYIGAFVESAAVLEDLRPREAIRASFEVTKLIRSGHSVMVSAYILLVIVLWIIAPGRPGVATPTVAVWAYALVCGLLNVAFLSAFVHRWMLLRPLVTEADGAATSAGAGGGGGNEESVATDPSDA